MLDSAEENEKERLQRILSSAVVSQLHQKHCFPAKIRSRYGKIPTEQFLSACQGIADFVGFLGAAFSPVKADISGNVAKVRTRFEKDRIGQRYLQDLIDNDLKDNGGRLGIATEGLLWLKRGLEFMLEMLTLMVQEYRSTPDKSKTENLVGVINKAYESSLKRHHGFMSKQLFKLVIHAAPYRRTILKAVALGKDGLDDISLSSVRSSSAESSNLGLFLAEESMVFRFLRTLLNDERVIQQLSESAPIRALARAVIRGGKTVQDKLGHTDAASRIEKFMKLYQEEYQKALKK
nr:Glycolipid transfer protein domain containing protein [Haemonchus contortus]